MSCPFYWWNNHFACRKSGKDVNEDVYYKYCRGYDYRDCPIYKGQDSSSGGCYLTTACTEAMGLPDDCRELQVLRSFRDGYIKRLPNGNEEICEYYFVAPQIISVINETEALPRKVFEAMYRELVAPCVALIDDGELDSAYTRYKSYAEMLKCKYLS